MHEIGMRLIKLSECLIVFVTGNHTHVIYACITCLINVIDLVEKEIALIFLYFKKCIF